MEQIVEDKSKDRKICDGVAYLKKEFLIPLEIKERQQPQDGEPPLKKQKKTGVNRKRPKLHRVPQSEKLCRSYWPGIKLSGDEPCIYEKCRFSHDVKLYLDKKLEDLGTTCHNYETFGYCPFGVICRYGASHIESLISLIDNDKRKKFVENPPILNALKKDVQFSLWKKKYDFSTADKASQKVEELLSSDTSVPDKDKSSENNGVTIHKNGEADPELLKNEISNNGSNKAPQKVDELLSSDASVPDKDKCSENSGVTIQKNGEADPELLKNEISNNVSCPNEEKLLKVGPVSDEDLIKLRPSEKRKIIWRDQLYLAPLTTLGNTPFRRVCKSFGADITCGEMAIATNLLQGSSSEWALVKKHESETCFGIQLCGNNEKNMTKCAQLMQDTIDVDFIDINMGCPIGLIFDEGSGSALMRRLSCLKKIVLGMTEVLRIPLTLKMRTGIYNKKNNAHEIIEKAKLWDVNMITVHGRTKEQRYVKYADWNYIDECCAVADPIPLFGSGDVFTYAEYEQRRKETRVAGVMLGRGALVKPWLFTEIKEKREWDISSSERMDLLRKYVNYGLEHWGSDTEGVEKTRRFLLEWLSFLHRYIPVGLLERAQAMNLRPEPYFGRNELETIMASNKVDDWIKISEMLLGKVPEYFEFLPKHRANSWS